MGDMDSYKIFLQQHMPQLQSSDIPQLFWDGLFMKLKRQIFDAGSFFELGKIEYVDAERNDIEPSWKLFVSEKQGVDVQYLNNIFLIDHAWRYDLKCMRENLIEIPGLLHRMCSLMDINMNATNEEKIEYVIKETWRYNQHFSMNCGTIEDRMPQWYIMDEVGSAINHSDDPNVRMVPFLHIPEHMTYTLLFPLRDIAPGEEVTRNFVEGQTNDPQTGRALLLPWVHSCFDDKSFEQTEPDVNYFSAGHSYESLPERTDKVKAHNNTVLKVFSQYEKINDYLTHSAFEITDDEKETDILWLVSHFKSYKELSISRPHVFINQFPYEYVLTIKDLLSIICRRKAAERLYDFDTLDTYPAWLPTTYNLNTELVQFVAYFMKRKTKGLDNYWICKPWNLARGLDIHITNNLYHILRLPCTGPKIAQKYITRPVLYHRPNIGEVKFDVRYVVLLKSVRPLCAYAYANFFLRFANLPFVLNNFDVYEQHFTVMNYTDETQLYHVKCVDFIVEWDNQYPNYPWKTYVEPKLLFVLRQVLEAAVMESPPKGIAHNPQSRAVYATDMILEWKDTEMQPKLLEINFMPDYERACKYYPDFFNDIFKCLFLEDDNPEMFHVLNSSEA